MTERRFLQSIVILAWAMGGMMTVLPAHAFDGPGDFDCAPRLQVRLNSPIVKLRGKDLAHPFRSERIKTTLPLALEFSQDYRFLTADMNEQLFGLTDEQRSACRNLAVQIKVQLDSFFERHMNHTLSDAQGLPQFYLELRRLLDPWSLRVDRNAIREKFKGPLQRYMVLSLGSLQASLLTTRWSSYGAMTPSLEEWTDDWEHILGADAPGAVLFESKRIALQASELSPGELQIMLFHELSHLDDHRARDPVARQSLTEVEAEEFAWSETLDYMSYVESAHVEISDRFARIRSAISAAGGLRNWVEAVVASRRHVP